jgi:hypothetical protein
VGETKHSNCRRRREKKIITQRNLKNTGLLKIIHPVSNNFMAS